MLSTGPFFLAQICTKLFSGFAPDPTGGAHCASSNPLVGKGEGRGGEGNRKGEGSNGRLPPLKFKSGYTPLFCV